MTVSRWGTTAPRSHQPRPGRPGRPDNRTQSPVSRRFRALPRHMFAPTMDRRAAGQGFTHEVGDLVTVASAQLGTLTNQVVQCPDAEPWRFGIADLMRNLAARKLI